MFVKESSDQFRLKAPAGLLCFVSGHGYGHAVRTFHVLRELIALAPDLPIWLRTEASESLFENVALHVEISRAQIDAGVTEGDPLTIDWESSAEKIVRFVEVVPRIVESEVAWARSKNVSAVFSDIPFLAPLVADQLGVPCVGMSNFLWDWIYEPILEKHPQGESVLSFIRECYSKLTFMLRLPFSHGMVSPERVVEAPLVAPNGSAPGGLLSRLRIPPGDGRKRVLISVRGGMPSQALDRLARASASHFFVHSGMIDQTRAENVRSVTIDGQTSFEDLIGIADVVIGKPGYGLISACVANRKRLLCVERTGFREDEIFKQEVPRHIPFATVSRAEFEAGDGLVERLMRVSRLSFPPPSMGIDGAAFCSRQILNALQRRNST